MSLNPSSGTTWTACVGQSFSRTINVSGGRTPLTNISCSLSGNCGGLTSSCSNISATVSGTPSQAGTCSFNVAWRDSCNPPQTVSGTYTISNACQPMNLNPPSGTSWTTNEGNDFSQTINITGGTSPISNMSCSFGCDNHVTGLQGTCYSTSATIYGTPTLTSAYQGKCTLSATWRDSCSCGTQTSGLYTVYVNPPQVAIINKTQSTVYYRKGNDTTCYEVGINGCIVVNPGETIRLFTNLGQCNSGIHSCTYTYNQLRQYDSNNDGNVRLRSIQQNQCTIDEYPTDNSDYFCI